MMPDRFLADDAVIAASEGQLSSQLDGEVVILDLNSGVYFGLNAVGARVWELCRESKTFSAICSAIADEFDVNPGQCRRDVSDLIVKLESEGLVQVAQHAG